MFKVTVQTLSGNEFDIYYPGDKDYVLSNAVLTYDVGLAGEFNFTIPFGHPSYDQIVYDSIITVYKDNVEFWRGDIRNIKTKFDKSLEVYCLEDLAWLGDEPIAMVQITNQTYAQRFSNALNIYNSNQVAKRKFSLGRLTAVPSSDFCNWVPEYGMTLLDGLRRFIAGSNGYLKVRRVISNGTLARKIDIVGLNIYGKRSSQTIEFGSNLLDYTKNFDATNIINVLYPYGAETETELYEDIMQRIVGTPIQNDESISTFGRRAKSVVFDTDDETTLNNLASAYLSRYSQPHIELEISAVDLGSISNVDEFEIGDSVRVLAPTYGIDQWLYITHMDVDLLNPANNQINLADELRKASLTSQVATQAEDLKDIRTPASVLDEAKRNAWSIIEGDNGGIVTFDVNGEEQIVGIRIANNLDIDQATMAWGWNVNGLAYLHREYPSDEWQVGIAMTMNGEIVADYITAGEMSADRINGGHIRANLITALNGTTTVGANTLEDFATKASTIIDVDVEYAKNQSSTTAPTSGWSTSSPQWEEGYYIWQRTKTTDGNNQASYSTPVCIQGADGQAGPAGVGVSAIVEQYYLSTSDQTPTGGSWSTNQPAWVEGKYIWTRSHVTWTNGTTTDTDPVLAKAINGANESVKDLDDDLDQEGIMDRLTGLLATEGIYLENNHVYVNASMIHTGFLSANRIKGDTLTLGGSNNTNGQMVVKDANGTDIVTANNNGISTTHLIATDDSEFGNLKIGKKNVQTPIGELLMSYIYGDGWIEYWYETFEGVLSKSVSKTVYFSPYYDGWSDDLDVNILFSASDANWQPSHDTTTLCQVALARWTGTAWSTIDTLKFNYYGQEINDKDYYFTGLTKNDKTIYRLAMKLFKQTWAEDYDIDVYCDSSHVFELNPYEITGSFRGHLEGSASLYSLSVNDTSINKNGNLTLNDEETRKSYTVSGDGFKSSDGRGSSSSTDGSAEITSHSYPKIEIKKASSSDEYINIHTGNPSIRVRDSSTEEISITPTIVTTKATSSRYTTIDNSEPTISVNYSDSDFIRLLDASIRIQSASNTYAIFQGSSNLSAYRSGTAYSIAWTSSDRRYKEDIIPLDVDLSKNLIDATEPKRFKFINEEGTHYGMIAQEARELLDNLGETDAQLEYCSDEENDFNPRNINYQEYIPHLINYVKDLRAEIVALKNIINTLKEDK